MDKDGIEAAFKAAGLERVMKDVERLARPSIRLVTQAVEESVVPVGASKLGGMPDLPTGVAWPERKGEPQSFIGQIRLADTQGHDTDNLLPQHGMLWFFYDAKQETYGDDPGDVGGWSVIYKDVEAEQLQRIPAPKQLPAGSQFHACTLSFVDEWTLPQQPELELPNFDWSADEQKRYETLLSTFPSAADRASIHHRLLGHPDTIQDDMRQQCQLVSHGVKDGDDAQAQKLMQGAMDWRLLLQVDTDEHAGMRWANNGMLYYWMNGGLAPAERFGKTWLVLQSE